MISMPMNSSGRTSHTSATEPMAASKPAWERAEFVDDPRGALARVERVVGRLVDRVVVAADRLAVLAQDLQLAGLVTAGEQVARVGVLRHQPQRLPLPAAADHDGRVRPAQR